VGSRSLAVAAPVRAGSARKLRPPCPPRHPPVDAFEQHAQLRRLITTLPAVGEVQTNWPRSKRLENRDTPRPSYQSTSAGRRVVRETQTGDRRVLSRRPKSRRPLCKRCYQPPRPANKPQGRSGCASGRSNISSSSTYRPPRLSVSSSGRSRVGAVPTPGSHLRAAASLTRRARRFGGGVWRAIGSPSARRG